jgi:hypothetical protein
MNCRMLVLWMRKRINDEARLDAQRRYLNGAASFGMTYGNDASGTADDPEPFAVAHRS